MLITAGVRSTTATVDRVFYRIDRHISMTLVYHNQHGRPRRKNNLIARSSKSEAEVTNNRRLRLTYNTIGANCWQTRSIARALCDSRATTPFPFDTQLRSPCQSIAIPHCKEKLLPTRRWNKSDDTIATIPACDRQTDIQTCCDHSIGLVHSMHSITWTWRHKCK